jgi:ADP-heptose:LPS heptosyltransferase
MGMGDEILVSGIAKRVAAMTNHCVTVLDSKGSPRICDLWDGLHYINQKSGGGPAFLMNAAGVRQYYSHMEGNRIIWRKWDIAPGEIRLTDEERRWAEERVPPGKFLVLGWQYKEKGGGGKNKDWGIVNWTRVATALRGYYFVQLMPPEREDNGLFEADPIHTPTFRHACAILERSIGYVGHEGGLHHAAAALGKPAVVVFGGYISPEVTGYPEHTNLYSPDERYPLGCGTVTPCEHCKESMSKITVEHVVGAVREMING